MTNKQGAITPEKLNHIQERIRTSASSFGLLPQTVFLISIQDQSKGIFSALPQVDKATHLIVFTAWTEIRHENINELIAHIASSRNLSLDNMVDYKTTIKILLKNTDEVNCEWTVKQAYIALGVGLSAAAELNVFALPVEEFDHETLDGFLRLRDKGLRSIAILALGQNDEAGSSPGVVKDKLQVTNYKLTYQLEEKL